MEFRCCAGRSAACSLVLSCALLATPPARGELVGLDTVNHVIQIAVDGLRSDRLQDFINNSPATYPNFARLQQEGSVTYNARTDFTSSVTIPNHASMITGRPVEQPAGQPNTVHHGYTSDFPGMTDTLHANGNPNVPYKASTFDVVHDLGLGTALFASKSRFEMYVRSYNSVNGAPDTSGADNGKNKISRFQLADNTSANIVNSFITNMNNSRYAYSWVHLTEPDGAGHSFGWSTANYAAAVAVADARLGQIFAMIDANPQFSGHTAIILTADHGGGGDPPGGPLGGDRGHFNFLSPLNYTIPFMVWGSGLPAGSNLYDYAPNRLDPGTERPDYDSLFQPFRNVDAGNLALDLLGLSPVPGSTVRAVIAVPEPAGWSLAVVAAVMAAAAGLVRSRRRRRNLAT